MEKKEIKQLKMNKGKTIPMILTIAIFILLAGSMVSSTGPNVPEDAFVNTNNEFSWSSLWSSETSPVVNSIFPESTKLPLALPVVIINGPDV